jgi:hypothetical protein
MTPLLTGLKVDYTDPDDPVLIRPDGSTIDTWRENYPLRTAWSARSTTGTSGSSRSSC